MNLSVLPHPKISKVLVKSLKVQLKKINREFNALLDLGAIPYVIYELLSLFYIFYREVFIFCCPFYESVLKINEIFIILGLITIIYSRNFVIENLINLSNYPKINLKLCCITEIS